MRGCAGTICGGDDGLRSGPLWIPDYLDPHCGHGIRSDALCQIGLAHRDAVHAPAWDWATSSTALFERPRIWAATRRVVGKILSRYPVGVAAATSWKQVVYQGAEKPFRTFPRPPTSSGSEKKSYLRDTLIRLMRTAKGLGPSALPVGLCASPLRVEEVGLRASHEEVVGEEPASLSVFDYVWYHRCATPPRRERKAG